MEGAHWSLGAWGCGRMQCTLSDSGSASPHLGSPSRVNSGWGLYQRVQEGRARGQVASAWESRAQGLAELR